MRNQTASMSTVAAIAMATCLPSFDLSRVMGQVAKKNPDWSPQRLDDAEQGYRRFVYMAKMDSTPGALQPTSDIDQVWHAHILFTRQYADDMDSYLGRFLHHNPFDEHNPAFAPKHTADLYRSLFGEEYVSAGEVECDNCCDCSNC